MSEVGNLVAKVSMDQTGFQQGITKLNRELKVVQSEFKAAAAGLGDFGKGTEGLKLRAESLNKQLDIQRKQVQELESAYKKSVEVKGADAKATQNLEIRLNNAKAQMATTEAALRKTTAELEKQSSKWYKLSKTCEEAGNSLKAAGSKLTDVGKNLSMKVTAPIVAAGAAAFKMAADVEDAMGATDQIFKSAAGDMKSWADSLESYYGIAKGEALEYSNMMGSMLQNIGGLTEEEAAKQAQTLIKLAGDLAAMYGGSTADAVRALTGALKGNNTMLDNYGMAANDALVKTKAFEMGLHSGKGEMDLATKQAATLALIMEQSGAAQGQAAREAEGSSGAMRAFATELKNLSTAFGEHLLPAITPIIASLSDMVKRFAELSPQTQGLIIKIAGIAAAIGPVKTILGPFVGALGGVAAGIGKVSLAIQGGAAGIGILTTAFPALGTALTLITGPIGIAVAAIAALVAAGVYLYKNWDTIKEKAAELGEKIVNVWNTLKNKVAAIWDGIKNAVVGAFQWMYDHNYYFQMIVDVVTKAWEVIRNVSNVVWTEVSSFLTGLWSRIRDQAASMWNAILKTITGITDCIKGLFDSLVSRAWNWGANLLTNFIDGIKSMFNRLRDTLAGIGETVAGFLGFHSPTKLGPGRFADDWAPNFMKMFAKGIEDNAPLLEKSLIKAVESVGSIQLKGDLSARAALLSPGVLQPAVANSYSTSRTTYQQGGNTINITVQDGEDLLRTLHKLGVRIP